MFAISEENRNGLRLFQLTNLEAEEYVCILPDAGCALNNFVINAKGNRLDLIDGYKDQKDLNDTIEKFFKGHFLFPFPNRIYGGTYLFEGKSFWLNQNFPHEKNAIHGMVYDQKFFLKHSSASERSASASFEKIISGEFEGYPFHSLIRLTFTYFQRNLKVDSEIVNTGEGRMPVGIGWHPYFRIGSAVDGLKLKIPGGAQWDEETKKYNPSDIISGKEPIGNQFIDHCFKKNNPAPVSLSDENKGITLYLDGEEDFSYFQVFTPAHRKSIAIEPMTCVPDSFNNKEGLKVLEKKEPWLTSWSLKISES